MMVCATTKNNGLEYDKSVVIGSGHKERQGICEEQVGVLGNYQTVLRKLEYSAWQVGGLNSCYFSIKESWKHLDHINCDMAM